MVKMAKAKAMHRTTMVNKKLEHVSMSHTDEGCIMKKEKYGRKQT